MADARLTARIRTAHGDAWEVEGRLRRPYGGGAARVRGARLMASGIAQAQWNNADVTGADVDVDAVRAWYGRRGVPWGVRVPVEVDLELGTPLFVKRCSGVLADAFRPTVSETAVEVGPADPSAFAALDSAFFGGDLADAQAWVAPQLRSSRFRHWVAKLAGMPVGIATTVRSDGEAGPAAYLTGVATAAGSSGRNVYAALAAVAAAEAFEAGATLVHANPGDDDEASALADLGGVEVPGFLVRVVAR